MQVHRIKSQQNFKSIYSDKIIAQRKKQVFDKNSIAKFLKSIKGGEHSISIKDGCVQAIYTRVNAAADNFRMIFPNIEGIDGLYKDSALIEYIDNLLKTAKQNCTGVFECRNSNYPTERFYNDCGELVCEDVYIKNLGRNHSKVEEFSTLRSTIYNPKTKMPLYEIKHSVKDGMMEIQCYTDVKIQPVQEYSEIVKYNKKTGKKQFSIDLYRGLPKGKSGLHSEYLILYDKDGNEALVKHNYGTITEPLTKSIQFSNVSRDKNDWIRGFFAPYINDKSVW